jgi:AcrR family transcriptional regulator
MGTSSTFENLPPNKQERILDGALSEFADKGYARASLNTLVARLGIAKGSIFQYFTDKAGLFRHVFDFAVQRVKDHLRQVRESTRGLDFSSRLHLSMAAGLELIEENPRLFNLYLRIMFEGDIPFRAQLLNSILVFGRDYLVDLLREGVADGELDPELDLELAAFVVEAVLERFLVASAVEHLDPGLGLYRADPEAARERAAQVVELLKKGLEGAR